MKLERWLNSNRKPTKEEIESRLLEEGYTS